MGAFGVALSADWDSSFAAVSAVSRSHSASQEVPHMRTHGTQLAQAAMRAVAHKSGQWRHVGDVRMSKGPKTLPAATRAESSACLTCVESEHHIF